MGIPEAVKIRGQYVSVTCSPRGYVPPRGYVRVGETTCEMSAQMRATLTELQEETGDYLHWERELYRLFLDAKRMESTHLRG